MRRPFIAFAISLFASAVLAAPPATPAHPELLVSTAWLAQHLHDANVTVVDIGEREAFEQSHIAGAHFVSVHDLVVTRDGIPNEMPDDATLAKVLGDAGIPDHGRIVIYARKIVPAARAFFTLEYAGRRGHCALLDGMFAKWTAESRPVESGPPAAAAAHFTVHPDRGLIVSMSAMKLLSDAASMNPAQFAIVDARPAVNYDGSEPGEEITRGGHIPSAVSVPSTTNLQDGVLRSPEELRAIYDKAGVKPAASVVTYCRTGMEASLDYFVLRYLGRTVHLYDGSYFEWSRAADNEVVK